MEKDTANYTPPRIEPMSEDELFRGLSTPQHAQAPQAPAGWYGYPMQAMYCFPQYGSQAIYSDTQEDPQGFRSAEGETSHRVPRCFMSDAGDRLTIRLELPGATAEEITLDVEPMTVTVSTSPEPQEPSEGSVPFWGALDLGCEVELAPENVVLENGVLTFQLAKAKSPIARFNAAEIVGGGRAKGKGSTK
ncbi:hypothetical protein FMN50_13740 [Rhodobacterales bacterium]|nr:hypothetical protein FMN50_13740 [Rhodobacterales bacterium]